MTYDDWKAALLPLGWSDRGTHITSPKSASGHWVSVYQDLFTGGCYMEINPLATMPPDLATMRALMTGLQIPMTPTNTTGGQGESHE